MQYLYEYSYQWLMKRMPELRRGMIIESDRNRSCGLKKAQQARVEDRLGSWKNKSEVNEK